MRLEEGHWKRAIGEKVNDGPESSKGSLGWSEVQKDEKYSDPGHTKWVRKIGPSFWERSEGPFYGAKFSLILH